MKILSTDAHDFYIIGIPANEIEKQSKSQKLEWLDLSSIASSMSTREVTWWVAKNNNTDEIVGILAYIHNNGCRDVLYLETKYQDDSKKQMLVVSALMNKLTLKLGEGSDAYKAEVRVNVNEKRIELQKSLKDLGFQAVCINNDDPYNTSLEPVQYVMRYKPKERHISSSQRSVFYELKTMLEDLTGVRFEVLEEHDLSMISLEPNFVGSYKRKYPDSTLMLCSEKPLENPQHAAEVLKKLLDERHGVRHEQIPTIIEFEDGCHIVIPLNDLSVWKNICDSNPIFQYRHIKEAFTPHTTSIVR